MDNLNLNYKNIKTLTLAYIGDAVYELMVRNKTIEKYPNLPLFKLHVLVVDKVKAFSQSKIYDYLKTKISADEYEIMKMGRNNKVGHYPKNSNPIEYHKATGVETLFGYLFLNKEYDKLSKYFNDAYCYLEEL